jgi:hypothetical protein
MPMVAFPHHFDAETLRLTVPGTLLAPTCLHR